MCIYKKRVVILYYKNLDIDQNITIVMKEKRE